MATSLKYAAGTPNAGGFRSGAEEFEDVLPEGQRLLLQCPCGIVALEVVSRQFAPEQEGLAPLRNRRARIQRLISR